MSELVITEKNLLKLQQICDANLLNEILEEVNVVITSQSNFWDVTSFFHTKTEVALIDKNKCRIIFHNEWRASRVRFSYA